MKINENIIWHVANINNEKVTFILNCKNNNVMELNNDASELFLDLVNGKEIDEEYYLMFKEGEICD